MARVITTEDSLITQVLTNPQKLVVSHCRQLPSGKPTKNYGKSPFLMGKSTISMAIFNSYVSLPEGNAHYPIQNIHIWLVVHIVFVHFMYGIIHHPLTFTPSFFKMVIAPPTSYSS